MPPSGRPISSKNTNDKDDPVVPIGPFLFATYDVNNVVSTEEQHLLQPQETKEQHLVSYLANRDKAAAAGVVAAHIMEGFEPKDHFYLYVCKKLIEGRVSSDSVGQTVSKNSSSGGTQPDEEKIRLGRINVQSISGSTVLEDGSIPVVAPLEPSLAASLMPVSVSGTFGRKSSLVFTSDPAIAAHMEAAGGHDTDQDLNSGILDLDLDLDSSSKVNKAAIASHKLTDVNDEE